MFIVFWCILTFSKHGWRWDLGWGSDQWWWARHLAAVDSPNWRPRVAESVADFGPKEVLCSTWIDILPQKLLITDLTHQIGPQRHPEKILGSKKRMLFLDVFCLPNASLGIPCPSLQLLFVCFNSDASPRLRTTCLDPGRRRNSSRWASMGCHQWPLVMLRGVVRSTDEYPLVI